MVAYAEEEVFPPCCELTIVTLPSVYPLPPPPPDLRTREEKIRETKITKGSSFKEGVGKEIEIIRRKEKIRGSRLILVDPLNRK